MKGKNSADARLRVSHSVTLDKESGELIIKVVNALPKETEMPLTINGAGGGWSKAVLTTFTSDSPEDRDVSAPTSQELQQIPSSLTLPAYSYQILRLKR